MREQKWVDCPNCGAKGSMEFRSGLTERREPKDYPAFEVADLEGHLCGNCGEGFWTRASERKLAAASAEHRARHDSERVVAAELASVSEAAEALHVSVQAIHQMMASGRLRYTYAAGLRLPIRRYLSAQMSGTEGGNPRG